MKNINIKIKVPTPSDVNLKGGMSKVKGFGKKAKDATVGSVQAVPAKIAHVKRAKAYADMIDSKSKAERFLNLSNEEQAQVMDKKNFQITEKD